MKIAYVITRCDSVGGAQIHVRDLALESVAQGHEIVVITGQSGEITGRLEAAGVRVRVCPGLLREINPLRDLRAVRELTRIMRDELPDVVSAHSSKAGLIGRLAANRAGIPALFTAHGWAFTPGVPLTRRIAYTLIERLVERFAARIICVSDFDRQLAIARGMSPARLVTIHNGMPDILPELRASPAAADPVRLIMVARFDRQKDHETLFRAMATLPDVELDLVGDGPGLEADRDLATRLGLSARVRFLGHRADVVPILARAQMFVLSSRWEGFPRSILEAMRAGLPVVASNVGGVEEAVIDGLTGFVVTPGDREEMAERLRDLVRSPKRRAEMGEAGRHRYERMFRFETMFAQTIALQKEVAAEAVQKS